MLRYSSVLVGIVIQSSFTFTLPVRRVLKCLPSLDLLGMKPNRRQLIVATGAISIGTVGTLWQTNTASALEVSMGNLTVANANHTGGFDTINVEVTTEIRWKNADADTLEIALAVGDMNNEPTELDTQTTSISNRSGSHTTDLYDNVLESATLGRGDFELLTGMPQRSTDIQVAVHARLLKGDNTVFEKSISDVATVTITEQTAEITMKGEGDITVK